MKLPRRKFLHLAAGAAALPAVSRFARAVCPGGLCRRLPSGTTLVKGGCPRTEGTLSKQVAS
jgi:hypothetical protein